MKDIELIEEIKRLFPSEFLNLYFVYKGVKRGYYNSCNKNSQNKIIKLCEKLKLNYLFIKDNRFDDSYFIFISKKKIKEPDYYIKDNERNHKNIGLFIGFPKNCVDNFGKEKNTKFGHEICVELRLKDKILSEDIIAFKCNKRMIFYLKNMKNKIKKVIEKNLLSDIIDYEISAEIREEI